MLEVASGQIGVQESTGHNDGPVAAYMPAWARGKGLPWCAWFVGWCWRQAFGEWLYGQHWGGGWDLFREAREAGDLLSLGPWPELQAQPGDVFVILHTGDVMQRGPSHVGFIGRVSDDGERVNTIEGNLRNGVRVATRQMDEFTAVIHPYRSVEDFQAPYDRGLIPAPMAHRRPGDTR